MWLGEDEAVDVAWCADDNNNLSLNNSIQSAVNAAFAPKDVIEHKETFKTADTKVQAQSNIQTSALTDGVAKSQDQRLSQQQVAGSLASPSKALLQEQDPQDLTPGATSKISTSAISTDYVVSEAQAVASLNTANVLSSSVNSLSAVASAIENLNQLVSPQRKAKNRHKNQYVGPSASMILTKDDLLPQDIELRQDNILALAERVFAYVDALKPLAASYETQISKNSTQPTQDQLLEVKAMAQAVTSDALKLGKNVQDFVQPPIPVVRDPDDHEDPFAGGHNEQLKRVSSLNSANKEQVVQTQGANAPAIQSKDLQKQQEISSLISAIKEDAQNEDEDESIGEREKAYNTLPIHTKQKSDTKLYADGMPIDVGFVDGVREGESMEEMLRRVQQSALAQLSAEEENVPYVVPAQNVVPAQSTATDKSFATSAQNIATSVSQQNLNADPQKLQQYPAQHEESFESSAPNDSCFHEVQGISQSTKKDNTQDDPQSSKVNESGNAVKGTAATENYDFTANNAQIEQTVVLEEMDDPFADESSTKSISSSFATSLDLALADTQELDSAETKDATKAESTHDVVGEILRAQLDSQNLKDPQKAHEQASKEKAPVLDSQSSVSTAAIQSAEISKVKSVQSPIASKLAKENGDATLSSQDVTSQYTTSQDVSYEATTPKIEETQVVESAQDSVAYATQYVPVDDEYVSDDEDDDADFATNPSSINTNADSFNEIEEQNVENSSSGIGLIADGSDLNVPIAERYERERIENSYRQRQDRLLQPEDFLSAAENADLWACDFKAAGYIEGAPYSALCSSVRKIDPSDPDRWIIVLSDHFRLFALDPSFTAELNQRFQVLKRRHIEISIQLCSGLPEGCVRTLALKMYDEALSKARQEFMQDRAIASIAQLAGADLRSCSMKIFKRDQQAKKK